MELANRPNVTIGAADGYSIRLDPLTGLPISASESSRDPFAHIEDPKQQIQMAYELAFFAQATYPRRFLEREIMPILRDVQLGNPQALTLMKRNEGHMASMAMLAGCLGVKYGDPSAATVMAVRGLFHEPPMCLRIALENVRLMGQLARERGELETERRVEELVARLAEAD